MQPAGFNKTAIVTACTTGNPYTISYASTVLGPLTVIGTVQINIDPRTGLPLVGGDVRVTASGIVLFINNFGQIVGCINNNGDPVVFTGPNALTAYNDRVTQMTGEPDFGLNQLPGTDPNSIVYRPLIDVVNNSGIIRLVVSTTAGFVTGQNVLVGEVFGVTNANGTWKVTVVGDQYLDLQGSTYAGSYTGNGYVINNPSVPYNFNEIPRTKGLPAATIVGVQWINNSSQIVDWTNNLSDTIVWEGE
jgi:hypothetical protein